MDRCLHFVELVDGVAELLLEVADTVRGIVRSVRWHHRVGLVWSPLTRWRDCLVRIAHISYVNQTAYDAIDVLIRRRKAGFSAIFEMSRIVGWVDSVGARNPRGSWDVAILRAVFEAMFIVQKQNFRAENTERRAESDRDGRQCSCHQRHKSRIGAMEEKGGPSPRGSSQDVRPPIGANYRGSLAAARGSTRGSGSLRSSLNVSM